MPSVSMLIGCCIFTPPLLVCPLKLPCIRPATHSKGPRAPLLGPDPLVKNHWSTVQQKKLNREGSSTLTLSLSHTQTHIHARTHTHLYTVTIHKVHTHTQHPNTVSTFSTTPHQAYQFLSVSLPSLFITGSLSSLLFIQISMQIPKNVVDSIHHVGYNI